MAESTGGVDWTKIIQSTIAQIPSWLLIARGQPVPTPVPAGTQGGSIQVSRSGIAGSISPGILIAGAVVVVAVVVLVMRK